MGAAIIEIRGIKAYLRNGTWRCSRDPALLAEIQDMSATYLPDSENARVVAERLGGVVLTAREDEERDEEGDVVIH